MQNKLTPYEPWCVYQGDFIHKMGTQEECINWMTYELGFGMTIANAVAQGYSIERYRHDVEAA